jgi:hypothetical protein
MNKNRLTLYLFLLFSFLGSSCKHDSHRSFYYWKSVYRLSAPEKQLLSDLDISKLYIRFFDVDWDEPTAQALPQARIRFSDKIMHRLEITPVIYIVNKALLNTKPEAIEALANNILKLTEDIAKHNEISFRELQIDCDWTDNSHRKYFDLLKVIKSRLKREGKILSVTIRLHQVKYRSYTGVPDVDRGMLMFYNMGKISPLPSVNSIYNPEDAAKYLATLPTYPLPLDVALPAFSWDIHIRKGKVIELLNSMGLTDFEKNPNFIKKSGNLFTVPQPFFYHGTYYMKNDLVKVEEISSQDVKQAARQLKSKISKTGTVAFYHLDSLTISHYEKQDFEKAFSYFH